MYLPDFGDPFIMGVYLGAVLVFASVWFGGQPERVGFGILLLMLVIQLSLHTVMGGPQFTSTEIPVVVADLFGLAAFVGLMAWSARIWPIVAVSLMLFSLLGHFARATEDLIPEAYVGFQAGPTMIILAMIPLAVIAHRWRLWRRGFDRDWTPLRSDKALRKAAKRVALQKNYTRGRAKSANPRVGGS